MPAVMFCANCGKPICAQHTVHGRYCSEKCYREHQIAGPGNPEVEKHIHKQSIVLWLGGIILFLLVFAAVYYLMPYVVGL